MRIKPLEERLWPRIQKTDGCWLWTGAKSQGYGYIGLGSGKGQDLVHRVVWRLLVGPIPAGLHLDHMCHNDDKSCPGNACIHRSCCNPAHLVVATAKENSLRGRGLPAANARKTHCPAGHPYSDENTHVTKTGFRQCRTCGRKKCRERAFKRRWGDAKDYEERRVHHYLREGRIVTNREL